MESALNVTVTPSQRSDPAYRQRFLEVVQAVGEPNEALRVVGQLLHFLQLLLPHVINDVLVQLGEEPRRLKIWAE